jgi:sulfur-carrier protein
MKQLLEEGYRRGLEAALAARTCRARASQQPTYLGAWPSCRGVVVRLPLSTIFPEALDDVVCVGGTVGAVLADLAERCPELQSRIWKDDGGLWVNVSLNGVDVRGLRGFATAVRDGDELSLLPPAASEPRLGRLVALQPLGAAEALDELERLRCAVVELSEERERLARELSLRRSQE